MILALTADALSETIEACLDAGMSGHVLKPIDPATLIEAVQSVGGAVEVPPPATSATDRIESLRESLEADDEWIARMLDTFMTTLDDTRAGFTSEQVLREAAHRLKSGAGLLGFENLRVACERVELEPHERELLGTLGAEIDRVATEVQTMRSRLATATRA